MRITDAMIRAAATALANGAGARNGAPPVTNVLDMLSQSMRDRYLGDARAALEAAKAAQDAGA
jgi:hypothetical protein